MEGRREERPTSLTLHPTARPLLPKATLLALAQKILGMRWASENELLLRPGGAVWDLRPHSAPRGEQIVL